jgi:hypothetical protein
MLYVTKIFYHCHEHLAVVDVSTEMRGSPCTSWPRTQQASFYTTSKARCDERASTEIVSQIGAWPSSADLEDTLVLMGEITLCTMRASESATRYVIPLFHVTLDSPVLWSNQVDALTGVALAPDNGYLEERKREGNYLHQK